jgi:hypothetical protein
MSIALNYTIETEKHNLQRLVFFSRILSNRISLIGFIKKHLKRVLSSLYVSLSATNRILEESVEADLLHYYSSLQKGKPKLFFIYELLEKNNFFDDSEIKQLAENILKTVNENEIALKKKLRHTFQHNSSEEIFISELCDKSKFTLHTAIVR